jgi:hypothetical protein
MCVMQLFMLFFHKCFFFVVCHSDLEGSYTNGNETRHVNLNGT